MQRLSSRSTFFYKRVFPVLWFAFLAVITLVMASHLGTSAAKPEVWFSLLPPAFMTIIGLVIFKRLIFDLVDEVWLDGDHLLVKKGGDQVKVALNNVMNVSASTMTNPPRISLMLRIESSHLGKTVVFMPDSPRGFLAAFRPNPVATQLIECVDAARRSHA